MSIENLKGNLAHAACIRLRELTGDAYITHSTYHHDKVIRFFPKKNGNLLSHAGSFDVEWHGHDVESLTKAAHIAYIQWQIGGRRWKG